MEFFLGKKKKSEHDPSVFAGADAAACSLRGSTHMWLHIAPLFVWLWLNLMQEKVYTEMTYFGKYLCYLF